MVNQKHKESLNAILRHHLFEYSKLYDGELIEWDDITQRKYAIAYKSSGDIFCVEPHNNYVFGTVYFYSKSAATNAITDIIMPFIKEHPEIVW